MPSPRFCDIDASAPHYLSALRATLMRCPTALPARFACALHGAVGRLDASAPHYLSALRAKAALLSNRLHAIGCLVNGKRISNAFAPTPGALKLHAPMLSGSWVSTLCVSDIEPFLSLGVALFCRKFHPFHRTTQVFLHSHAQGITNP